MIRIIPYLPTHAELIRLQAWQRGEGVYDPTIYAEPYTTVQNYALEKDWVMREYVCEENNRDAADEFGRPSMDISHPDDKK